MFGDQPAIDADFDVLQVGADMDKTPDHVRVDGVVGGVQADVVVAAQADPVAPGCSTVGGSTSIAAPSAHAPLPTSESMPSPLK